MKIAIDIDGVIADSCSVFSKLALMKKLPVSNEQYDVVPGASAVQRREFHEIIDFTIGNQLTLVKPYTGVKKAIRSLSEMFDEIFFITARNKKFNVFTKEWLSRYVGNIGTLINLSSAKKTGYLVENKFDAFVEDRLRTVNESAEAGIRTFMVEHTWNSDRKIHPMVKIVPSLSFLPKLLRRESFI